MNPIKLYRFDGCGYCDRVQSFMDAKGIPYEIVEVPIMRDERTELFEISGQYLVPVIKDGDTVVNDSMRIISYLSERY